MVSPSSHLSKRRPARAFTLLELMVSVAIVCLLAAMILSGTKMATSKAREAACMNNLKTWGTLMSSFAGDNRQQLWVSDTATNPYNLQPWNSGATSPYGPYLSLRDTVATVAKIRMCPGAINYGYATTGYAPICPQDMRDAFYVQLLNVAKPSQYFLLCDAIGNTGKLRDSAAFTQFVKPVCAKPTTDIIRHGGRFNVLFADYHVGSYSWSDVEANHSTTIDVWTKAAGQ